MPLPIGASQTKYRRPYVGLVVSLSIVIIGLSWSPFDPAGTLRPTVCDWKLVPPAAIRFTTIRPGTLPWVNDSPPNQMFPREAAANVGSQQIWPLSLLVLPGLSIVCGSVRWVQVWPPSFVIQAG